MEERSASMYDNNNMELDYYPEEEKKKPSLVGSILKYTVTAFIVLVFALVFFRIAIANDTKLAKSFIWTPESVAAYNEKGSLTVISQELSGYTLRDENGTVIESVSYDELSEDGLFKTGNFMYVKETNELLVTVRYNDTCEEEFCKAYSLDPNAGEIFVFELTDGEKTYGEYSFVTDERFVYHYKRLIFKNVDLDSAGKLVLIGYSVGNPDREKPAVKMTVYDSNIETEAVKLDKYLPAETPGDLDTPPYVKFD